LENCQLEHLRGENEKGHYHFIVSRAVMPLPDLVKIMGKNISKKQINAHPNGMITLKGGDIAEEVKTFRRIVEMTPVSNWFEEEWFKEKQLVFLPV
ncbi:MAG: 16S rRNA (guanine(527)-N(7))-methyltransferase RsmG, partial [Prevotella sp.]|nr:16S rRNA (guanine(527)-N(7))-methyltransferase RsmG [Prevotella sp.]